MFRGTNVCEFGADPNRILDLMNLNAISKGDCWALAEVQTLLCHSSLL